MIRYNKSVIDWQFLEQQLLSSDPVNNCILFNCLEAWLIIINFIHNYGFLKDFPILPTDFLYTIITLLQNKKPWRAVQITTNNDKLTRT